MTKKKSPHPRRGALDRETRYAHRVKGIPLPPGFGSLHYNDLRRHHDQIMLTVPYGLTPRATSPKQASPIEAEIAVVESENIRLATEDEQADRLATAERQNQVWKDRDRIRKLNSPAARRKICDEQFGDNSPLARNRRAEEAIADAEADKAERRTQGLPEAPSARPAPDTSTGNPNAARFAKIRAQWEAMPDGPKRKEFYRQNRHAILRG